MAVGPGATARVAFSDSALAFGAAVGDLGPAELARPASEHWTVRELVAHASRALLTIETSIAAPLDPSTRRLESAADYFRAAMAVAGVHEGIVERARETALGIGDDPCAFVDAALERVLAVVARTPDDLVVQHFAGRIAFSDYLATRTLELVLHTADLQLALGHEVRAPEAAAALVCDLVVELADRADPLQVACALTGRVTPSGVNVLG